MKAHRCEWRLSGVSGGFGTDAFDANELYKIYRNSPLCIRISDASMRDLIMRPISHPSSFDGSYTDKYPL